MVDPKLKSYPVMRGIIYQGGIRTFIRENQPNEMQYHVHLITQTSVPA